MKMSDGEKMIFAAHLAHMLKNSRSCTVEDCINSSAAAVTLVRRANHEKLTDEAKDVVLQVLLDFPKEKDC